MVEDVYDQNMPIVFFWSLAASPNHVDISVASWCGTRISPVRFGVLHGPSPTIQPICVFFLSVNFWLGSWAKPNIAAFLFSRRSAFLLPFLIRAFLQSILDQVPGHPIRSHLSVFFCFFPILKDPLVKWDQVCCLGATRQFSICATTNNLIQTEPITHKFSNDSQSWQVLYNHGSTNQVLKYKIQLNINMSSSRELEHIVGCKFSLGFFSCGSLYSNFWRIKAKICEL